MPLRLAPRVPCVICGTTFPQRGRKRTCTDRCRDTYAAQRRQPARPRKPRPAPPTSIQYILDRVQITESGCWEWQQSLNPRTGYGQIGFKPYTAHRLAFYFTHSRYPDEQTRHMCHNRACCNPDHLREGTARDNWRDSAATHRAAARRLTGRTPANAIPTTVGDTTYPSQVAAMRALRVTWVTLSRLAA